MKKTSHIIGLLACLGISSVSCVQELIPSSSLSECTTFNILSTGNSTGRGMQDEQATRSVLQETVETKITDICLWAYDESGQLEEEQYFPGSRFQEPIQLYLSTRCEHHIYALANMGHVSAPALQTEAEKFTYRVPSYDDVAANGFPMAGKKMHLPAGQTEAAIPVERLFAKISLSMEAGEIQPDEITGIRIYNCNMKLSPFSPAGSKATAPEDLSSDEEAENICHAGWEGNQFVFYVPENVQGTLLAGNTDQNLKTPEQLAATGKEEQALYCTYLETTIQLKDFTQHNGVEGSLKYRFYLGSDNTSDFSIRRSQNYSIGLALTWNGQFYKENWRVDNQALTDKRRLDIFPIKACTYEEDGWHIQRGKNMVVVPGRATGAALKFHLQGVELSEYNTEQMLLSTYMSPADKYSLSQYKQAPSGWCMSEQTLQVLKQHHITWSFGEAVISTDPGYGYNPQFKAHLDEWGMVGFNRKKSNGRDSDIQYETFDNYLVLNTPPSLAEGMVIPIRYHTLDQAISCGCYLYTTSKEITSQLSTKNPVAGTCPTLTINDTESSGREISLSVHEECKDLVEYKKIGKNTFKLYLKKGGHATLGIDLTIDGTTFEYDTIEMDIEDPELKILPAVLNLHSDGTLLYIYSKFTSQEQFNGITMADSDELADERHFAPSLYEKYLKPQYEVLDGVTIHYEGEPVHCTNADIGIKFPANADIALWAKSPEHAGEIISMLKISIPSQPGKTRYMPIQIDSYLPQLSAKTFHGTYSFAVGKGATLPKELGTSIEKNGRLVIPGIQLEYDHRLYAVDIVEDAPQFDLFLDPSGQLEVRYHPDPEEYKVGKIDLTARIFDLNSGKLLSTQPAGYLYAYVYSPIGAYAEKRNHSLETGIRADILGRERYSAFKDIFQRLGYYSNRVSTNFDDMSVWTPVEGQRNWYTCPQVTSNGEMIQPNENGQNDRITRWNLIKTSGTVGEMLYIMVPGNGVEDYYQNWYNFKEQYRPALKMDLEGIQDLSPCPGAPELYFFQPAGCHETDSKGRPYYFLHAVEENSWINEDF